MAKYGDNVLMFFFCSTEGLSASLPMRKVLYKSETSWKGVPGEVLFEGSDGYKRYLVTGYHCPACNKDFFAADIEGLKHGCMKDTGIVHGKLTA